MVFKLPYPSPIDSLKFVYTIISFIEQISPTLPQSTAHPLKQL